MPPEPRRTESGPPPPGWVEAWRAARPAGSVLHLDSAACGRAGTATIAAVTAHLEREAGEGGYVAAELATPVIERLTRRLTAAAGVPGGRVSFTESASAAYEALVRRSGLGPGDVVAVAAGEWGGNLAALEAARVTTVRLGTDAAGRIDLDDLETRVRRHPPAAVTVTVQPAHRAVTEPVGGILAICSAHGVPVWLDAAQAFGAMAIPPGAEAVVGTGRKWWCGPRGVGVLIDQGPHAGAESPRWTPDHPNREAAIAARVGLAAAVEQWWSVGPDLIGSRLAEVGEAVRAVVRDAPGWRLLDDPGANGPVVILRPERADVAGARAALLEAGVLATAVPQWRAPLELTGPVLRFSPHVDLSEGDLHRLRSALRAVGDR